MGPSVPPVRWAVAGGNGYRDVAPPVSGGARMGSADDPPGGRVVVMPVWPVVDGVGRGAEGVCPKTDGSVGGGRAKAWAAWEGVVVPIAPGVLLPVCLAVVVEWVGVPGRVAGGCEDMVPKMSRFAQCGFKDGAVVHSVGS